MVSRNSNMIAGKSKSRVWLTIVMMKSQDEVSHISFFLLTFNSLITTRDYEK